MKRSMNLSLLVAALAATALTLATPRALAASADPAARPSQALPAGLQPVFYQALARDAGAAYNLDRDGCATLAKQDLTACFSDSGVHFTGAASPLALRVAAWGRAGQLVAVQAVTPVIEDNEVIYPHGTLTEWWRVLPVGFEQGFTIAERPAGDGPLVLALSTTRHSRESGNPVGKASRPSAGIQSHTGFRVPLRGPGMTGKGNNGTLAWGKLRYGKLVVTDARGRVIPATMRIASKLAPTHKEHDAQVASKLAPTGEGRADAC